MYHSHLFQICLKHVRRIDGLSPKSRESPDSQIITVITACAHTVGQIIISSLVGQVIPFQAAPVQDEALLSVSPAGMKLLLGGEVWDSTSWTVQDPGGDGRVGWWMGGIGVSVDDRRIFEQHLDMGPSSSLFKVMQIRRLVPTL